MTRISGSVPEARWRFTIGDDGMLSTGVLGMTVGAQQLSARSYAGLARLLPAGLYDRVMLSRIRRMPEGKRRPGGAG